MSDRVDFTWLPETMRAEMDELASRLGPPVVGSADLGDSPYLRRVVEQRFAEVCMVVRRPSGRLLVFRKPFYPVGIFRLLTGASRRANPSSVPSCVRATKRLASPSTSRASSLPPPIAPTADHNSRASRSCSTRRQVPSARSTPMSRWSPSAKSRLSTCRRSHINWSNLTTSTTPSLEAEIRQWGLLRALNHRLVWRALY